MSFLRTAVLTLSDYYVPQNLELIKLNQNESPFDLPLKIKRKISNRLINQPWNRYPLLNGDRLIQSIARYTNFPGQGIVIGNGSNELLLAVFLASCSPRDKIVVVKPGFSMYPRLAQLVGARLTRVELDADFRLNPVKILEQAAGAKLIVLAIPNNPTGTVLEPESVVQIAKTTSALLVIDEAYYEFYGKSCQHLIEECENIVIVRTLSKAFGLAGLRLGYLMANNELAAGIKRARLPFSIGIFQQIAGEVVLEDHAYLQPTIDEIVNQRAQLFNMLEQLSEVIPFPSHTNFILLRLEKRSAHQVFNSLYERGVLVRCFNEPPLDRYLRVTVGSRADNQAFINALSEVLAV